MPFITIGMAVWMTVGVTVGLFSNVTSGVTSCVAADVTVGVISCVIFGVTGGVAGGAVTRGVSWLVDGAGSLDEDLTGESDILRVVKIVLGLNVVVGKKLS